MKEKEQRRSFARKAVATIAALAVLAGTAAGVLAWHLRDANSSDDPSALGGPAEGTELDTIVQGDEWVLDMFRNLAPMVGSGQYEAWVEVGEDGAWDFKVEQPVGGEAAFFAFSDGYRAMADRTGTPCTIAAFTEETNAKGDSEEPFVPVSGMGSYSLCDAGAQVVVYEENDALRALAHSAYVFRASWEESANKGSSTDVGARYPSDVAFVRGGASYKGMAEIVFSGDVSDGRIREIAAEAGYEVIDAGSWPSGSKYIQVKTPEGGEEAALEAFEGYSEVKGVEGVAYFSAYDTAALSVDSAKSAVQSGRFVVTGVLVSEEEL